MKCERAQEQMSDYCEGALQGGFVVAFEQHIGQCDQCRAEVHGLKSIWAELDSAPVIDPPAGFRAGVWERIRAAETARHAPALRRPWRILDWGRIFARPAYAFAALAAILLLILLAPIAVPGTRSTAAMYWPWSLFLSHQTVQTERPALNTDSRLPPTAPGIIHDGSR